MIRRIQLFFGPTGSRVFVAWFALTGLASLILNTAVNQYSWVRPVQSLIVIVFLAGTAAIVLFRLPADERGRWVAILLPAVIALFLALIAAPPWNLVLAGGALGWVVATILITRNRMPVEYRAAVKHLRKSEYESAAKIMDQVIKAEPDHAQHYKFRAEVHRLWGKLKPAARDYQKITELEPQSPVGFNGLSEVHLQAGDYQQAHQAALKANQLAPDDWVTCYNLGLIEDRLKDSEAVIEHLNRALALKISDARHRLLIHLYLVRAYGRLGRHEDAEAAFKSLKRDMSGLEEWQTILRSDQAATLRDVIGDDVQTALELINGELKLADMRYA